MTIDDIYREGLALAGKRVPAHKITRRLIDIAERQGFQVDQEEDNGVYPWRQKLLIDTGFLGPDIEIIRFDGTDWHHDRHS